MNINEFLESNSVRGNGTVTLTGGAKIKLNGPLPVGADGLVDEAELAKLVLASDRDSVTYRKPNKVALRSGYGVGKTPVSVPKMKIVELFEKLAKMPADEDAESRRQAVLSAR